MNITLNKKESIDNCTFIKTVLMLSVILYHSCVYWTGTWFDKNPLINSPSLSVFARWLNSFHIYGFVLVSGYIYSFARNEKGKYQDRKLFLFGKVKRLLVPFYFVVIVWVIPMQQLLFHNNLGFILKNYILANNPNQLWFLWMLFVVFLIISFTAEIIDKSYILTIIISLCGYGLYIVLLGRAPNYFQIITAMQFLSVFLVGYYGRKTKDPSIPWYAWILIDIIVFCIYEFTPGDGILFKGVHYVTGFVLHVIGAIMAFEVLQTIGSYINWKKRKYLKVLAKYSMPMYLFHQQIIYLSIILLNGKVHPWINAGVNCIFALVGSFFISWILMRWKMTRFLIGEASKL